MEQDDFMVQEHIRINQEIEQQRINREMMFDGSKSKGRRGWIVVLTFALIMAGILFAWQASAQRVTWQLAAYYQMKGDTEYQHLGGFLGASFEPFYPWPVYLETGLGAGVCGNLKGAENFRLELPVNITWQWDPLPLFSMGPYAGASATYNKIRQGGPDFFTWGWQAGLSIRPYMFIINVAYHMDMLPYYDTGIKLRGVRFTLGFCF